MDEKEALKQARKVEKLLRPDDGWWQSCSKDSVIETAKFLLLAGLSSEDTSYVCSSLICVGTSEYGG